MAIRKLRKPMYGAGGVSRAMIKDRIVAEKISKVMTDTLGRLDESTAMAMEACSPEEFTTYRRAVGAIMGEIVLGILNPLYSEHPSLKPPEME